MSYSWQQCAWPEFRFELVGIEGVLIAFAEKAGQVSGVLKSLPDGLRGEAILDVMIAEAVKTSEIEGEYVSRPDVASCCVISLASIEP